MLLAGWAGATRLVTAYIRLRMDGRRKARLFGPFKIASAQDGPEDGE
jgi:hypothetical protein